MAGKIKKVLPTFEGRTSSAPIVAVDK